jgi:hypothetical protein
MHKLPQNRRWATDFSSDVFGSVVAGQNLDFDREGYLTLAPKSVSIYNQDDDANFSRVFAIVYLDNATQDGYFVLTRDEAFRLVLEGGPAMTQLSTSNRFANTSPDALVWQGLVHVSGYSGTTVNSWDGNSFTERITGLTSSKPQPMCVFENRNELAVGNGNTVKTYNTSYVLQNTLTIPSDYNVISIRWEENKIFVGTRHLHGGEAKIFTWDGSGTAAQAGYGVRCPRVYSLCNYQGGIAAVVSSGQLLRWTGGGFSPLKDAFGVEANFPVWYENRLWQDEDAGTASIGKVYDRGTVADGNIMYLNVSSSVASNESNTLLKNFPSGIWVFDPQVGLYHKALPSADKIQNVAVSSLSDSTLTLASAVQVQTGESVFIEVVGSLTGISANQTYYAIVLTSTTIKLAYSQADAHNGDAITLGGSAGVATVTVARNNQIGSVNDSEAGALALVAPEDVGDTFTQTPIIWGSRTYKLGDVDATFDSLNVLSQAFNVGRFITPKLQTSAITETWKALYQKLRNLSLDADSIVVKYRTRERFGLPTTPAAGTYSTSRTIGSSLEYFDQIEEGDEVVITRGYGAGRSAHVVSHTGLEIELDEAIPNAASGNELEFYVTDFKRLGEPITNSVPTVVDNYCQSQIGQKGAWIQFTIELRGSRVAIEEMLLTHEPAVRAV